MKAGWEVKALGEVCTFRNGLWTGKKGPFVTAKVIRNTNIRANGVLSLDDVAEIEVEAKQFKSRQLHFGDIILEKSGGGPKQPVGRAVFFEMHDEDFSFSNFTAAITVADAKTLDYRFLHLVLNWWHSTGVTEQIQSNSTGIRNLDFNAYKALEIPLPPLDEQKRIVAVLDAAFEGLSRARAHTETNLQNARELFETTLEQIFLAGREVWEPKAVRDLGSIQTGSTPKTNDKGNFGNFLPFVKPADFNQDGSLNYTDDGVSEQGAKQSRLLQAGSVLMVCIGATIGKVGYSTRSCVTNQQVNALTPDSGVDCKFIYYQMRSRNFQEQVHHASGQATLPIINKSKWSALTLFIPPTLEEQKSIVEQLDTLLEQFGSLQSHYRAKLADLDALRQALLQKAFAGELT